VYKHILETQMLPYARYHMPQVFMFQQDNDPKHKSRSVMDFLNGKSVELLNTPPQSPDLNPIEHMWGYVKTKLRLKKSQNHEVLWQNIQECWEEIDSDCIGKLILSMQKRCQAVIKAKGGPTKY